MRHFEWTLRWIHTFPYLFHDECSTNPTFPLKKNLLRVSSCGVCFIRHISSSAEKLKNKNGNWISRSIKVTFVKSWSMACCWWLLTIQQDRSSSISARLSWLDDAFTALEVTSVQFRDLHTACTANIISKMSFCRLKVSFQTHSKIKQIFTE